jgi:hypothetical protein
VNAEAIRAKIMSFAARPQGISRQDTASSFSMLDRTAARAMLDALEADGTLVGVLHPQQKTNGKPKTTLFLTRAAADAWCKTPRLGTATSPKLHDVRSHIKGLPVRNGLAPEQLPGGNDRGPRAGSKPAHQGPIKYTVAPPFVDRRWLPDVVRSVVNSRECSPWAVAATERRA